MEETDIKIENLSFCYKTDKLILDSLSFSACGNESIGIIGANGQGKSTLLKILVGLVQGFSGSIKIDDIELTKKTLSKIRQKIGYVFQESENQLFMTTVSQDVAFGPRNYGFPEEEVQKRTHDALEKCGILHLAENKNFALSGGEKKLAAIATILSMQPEIILMDEPSSALDPKNRRNLINILNSISALKIITSHDLDFIWDTCSRVVLLSNGKFIAQGTPEEILSNKTLLEENDLELPLSLCSRGI